MILAAQVPRRTKWQLAFGRCSPERRNTGAGIIVGVACTEQISLVYSYSTPLLELLDARSARSAA